MNSFAYLYSIEARIIKDGESVVSMGAPFVALSDKAAEVAIENSLSELIEKNSLNIDMIKNHRLVCLGKFYPDRSRPIVLNSGEPVFVLECGEIVKKFEKEETKDFNA